MISDKRPVQDFVSLLVVHRIQHVIITPGSRNAPFSLSLFEHADIHSYSIVDERSAAFIALGMAQQLEQPVVLICTSGTAALNLRRPSPKLIISVFLLLLSPRIARWNGSTKVKDKV
jgi:2-succinyl-5-enolpyruvyl-6-hydroxy-3-cyclohexene-1-carboxylate synthase